MRMVISRIISVYKSMGCNCRRITDLGKKIGNMVFQKWKETCHEPLKKTEVINRKRIIDDGHKKSL